MNQPINLLDDLKKSLSRLQKKDYEYFLQNWKPSVAGGRPLEELLDDEFFESIQKLQKRQFVQTLARLFHVEKKNPRISDIAKSNLLFMQLHSKFYLWQCYSSEYDEDVRTPSPRDFAAGMIEELQLLFDDAYVHIMLMDNMYWIWVQIHQRLQSGNRVRSNFYIIHEPHTPYFMCYKLRQKHENSVLEALDVILGGHNSKRLQLSGHCVKSLFAILVHGENRAQYRKYQLNQVHSNPLLGGKKRKIQEDESDSDCEGIVNENRKKRKLRQRLLQNKFGTGLQPKLERLEYKIESKFKATKLLPKMAKNDDILHFRVKFEGPSVLDGLRSIGKSGAASLPMKSHLSQHIYTKKINAFLLKQKKRPKKTEHDPSENNDT